MNIYKPEGMLIATPENREYLSSFASLERACMQGAILEANAIMCDENLNLYVDLGICKGIIEKSEAVYSNNGEEIKDIAGALGTDEIKNLHMAKKRIARIDPANRYIHFRTVYALQGGIRERK